jgi:cell shape-determining protein MreC
LSTLTKILIVLLSLFSLFLCGTVVTYVGTAKNYKNVYEDLKTELTALQKKNQSYQQQLEEKKRQMDELSTKLDTEMAELKAEKTQLEQNLRDAERAKTDLDERVKTLAAAALKFEQTVGGMEDSLKKTREELDEARAEGIKLTKNLNEITTSLEEKMAQLGAIDAEKKRLLEEKTKLERQLAGKTTESVITEPVTVVPDSATKAIEPSVSVALRGTVTAVDGSLVTLSIGSADGVEKGIIFHVIRNDGFVCDVRITEVDTEAAAGTIQLVQQQPKVGDIASTTW